MAADAFAGWFVIRPSILAVGIIAEPRPGGWPSITIDFFANDRRNRRSNVLVNGLTLLVVLALAIGIIVAWHAGVMRGKREVESARAAPLRPAAVAPPAAPAPIDVSPAVPDSVAIEQARLIRSLEGENAVLRRNQAQAPHSALADEHNRLLAECEQARAEVARYREIVVDLENNALPPLLDGPNMFDDLKLIVGVGPVLERMLHRLGITTFRQIARWSERDIDEFDAKLPEFPGRIRRDAWVTQARALHEAKFGEPLPVRER
jgi:predicted flap endonuclease-1-like 5' DNA nuclease